MKKETIQKIEEEINKKTTLPSESKDNIRKDVFINIVIAISMISFFTILIMRSVGANKTVRIIDFNIFSIILLSITICLFEIAYKKDSGKLAVYGIETLFLGIFTLFLPYIVFELDESHKKYYMLASIYISIYYLAKSIYIYIKEKKTHIEKTSDIKEIVKKEKRKNTKNDNKKEISKNNTTKKTENKKNNTRKPSEKIEQNQKQTTKKGEQTNKTKNTTKKTNINSKEQNKEDEKIVLASKKRGRPKKTETIEKNKQTENTLKKRGRPRKVVTSND